LICFVTGVYLEPYLNQKVMKFLEKWFRPAKETDIDKVTSSGRFYMTSEDLFDDKDEVLSLIKKRSIG
jgi:hypothetical protein